MLGLGVAPAQCGSMRVANLLNLCQGSSMYMPLAPVSCTIWRREQMLRGQREGAEMVPR